jgi:uncharacterized protein (DUF1684 family)
MANSTIFAALVVFGGIAAAADPSAGSYERSVDEWRKQHDAWLKADDGWLTVVGLNWLKEGQNRVGSTPGFEVSLPQSAPARIGTITVKKTRAHFVPEPGVAVTLNGQPARAADLTPGSGPKSDVVGVGRIKLLLIKRENKLAVRVKDNDSRAREKFTGSLWYPIDPSWRIQATFIPWEAPHNLTFDTLVGVKEPNKSPGYVSFERDGTEYRLEPVIDDNELRFVIRDETSGKTTYSASRFLYTDMPKGGLRSIGPVELDFNRAENPPCVFTDFATCPLPPPQNRLHFAVTAGEQMYVEPSVIPVAP